MVGPARILRWALGALLAAGVAAAPARADTLLVPAPGARNLAWAGGYAAWAAPTANGRWSLVIRAPDGTATTPAIPGFPVPPDPTIGSDRPAARRLLVVYSRCAGASAVRGCDVYAYDLGAGREERVRAISTKAFSEFAASVTNGRWVFARRGGPRDGMWRWSQGRRARRFGTRIPREMAFNGSRVANTYTAGNGAGLAIRPVWGGRSELPVLSGLPTAPFSPQLTRYHAAWLVRTADGVTAQATTRFTHHGVDAVEVRDATRPIPATADSLAVSSSISSVLLLDALGIEEPVPQLFAPH